MRLIIKTLGVILLACLLLAGALLALRNTLLAPAVIRLARDQFGLTIQIDSFRTGLWKPSVDVRGLSIENPPDFPDSEALRVERFYLSTDWTALTGNEIRLHEVRLEAPRLAVIRNAAGRTNLELLNRQVRERTPRPQAPSGSDSRKPETKSKPAPPRRPFRIDRLIVKMDEVQFTDFSRGEKPIVRTYPLHVDKTFTDVTDFEPVLRQIMLSAAAAAAPSVLEDLKALSDQAEKDPAAAKKKIRELRNTLRGLMQKKPEPATP